MTKSRNINKPKAAWTSDREKLMRDFYPHLPTQEIAKALGYSVAQIYAKANRMNLAKTAEFLASELSGRVAHGRQHPSMVASRFSKGHVSWNKGTKGLVGVHESCRATQFKKGQTPFNTMPIGSYRVVTEKTGKQHLQIKFSEAKGPNHMRWVPVTRWVWEQANGPLEPGYIVVFKAGARTLDPKEITLDRLECITLKENVLRNSIWTQDPELAALYQLKGAINRRVNRIQKESRNEQATH
jgi:hypothetical protein